MRVRSVLCLVGSFEPSNHSAERYRFEELSILMCYTFFLASKTKKNPSKFLATRKRHDRIEEILKSDGLGSKRWLFYPRSKNKSEPAIEATAKTSDNIDQRVKVDADFFRKYKRSKKVDNDAPIAKLKRWELLLYKKLGFLQAV
uniref:SFRICE_038180 n=1 Tax=Spodoptera frugiperda TaxID=7108 RepID=A0A2H1WT71_SPOFR